MIKKSLVMLLLIMLASCATFDRTNILPGQAVPGLGFSFEVPTQNNWTTVEYGSGNKIHLFQLNDQDSYSIIVLLNRGPYFGMYNSSEDHLASVKLAKSLEKDSPGYILHSHREWLEPKYGELCVRYTSHAEDWRGRNKAGPALISTVGLNCEHLTIPNVIVSVEISRRYEVDADEVDLNAYADALFSSFEYEER